ncbi:MAG: hypothetical protein HC933_00850 [Pleurocapsa sp. SU_196_0]|nr:hypothetical protein [Pleurocapsa sp. SU_196_0]
MTRSVTELLTSMMSVARTRVQHLEPHPDDDTMMTLSVRVPRRLKTQYDELASGLQITPNALMVSVLTGAVSAELASHSSSVRAIGLRWIALHRNHGLTFPEIVQLYPDVFTLPNLGDEQQLLERLTIELLTRTAEVFNVRRTWLETGNGPVFDDDHPWYSRSVGFVLRLVQLTEQGYRPRVVFLRSRTGRFAPKAEDLFDENDSLAIVLVVPVKVRGVEFQRYEWWGAERWTYNRAQSEACALIEFTTNIEARLSVSGYTLEPSVFQALKRRERHPSELGSDLVGISTLPLGGLVATAEYRQYADQYTEKMMPYLPQLRKMVAPILPDGVPQQR